MTEIPAEGQGVSDVLSTVITIGWTKSDLASGYISFIDGYRLGADQHEETITVDLPAEWDSHRIAEAVYVATNAQRFGSHAEGRIYAAIKATGYRGEEAHFSLSVGDTVTVAGQTLACALAGFVDTAGHANKNGGS